MTYSIVSIRTLRHEPGELQVYAAMSRYQRLVRALINGLPIVHDPDQTHHADPRASARDCPFASSAAGNRVDPDSQ